MFTRSRNGRRGYPARLNVERLEDRVLPHNNTLTAGLSAPALAGPAAVVSPSPDGPSHGHVSADSQAGDRLTASDTGKHTDNGQGNGGTPGGHGQGASALESGPGDPTPGKHGHGPQAMSSDDIQAKDSDSNGKGHGATAKKGHEKSDDDNSASGRVSSEDSSSGNGRGRGEASHADTQATSEEVPENTATASAPGAAEGEGGGRASEAPGLGSPLSAVETAEGGGAQAAAQPAAPASAASVNPLPVAGGAAAQNKGEGSTAEAAQAAGQAANTAAVLALLAARPAEPIPAYGQAGLAGQAAAAAVGVTAAADVYVVRAAPAQAAAPGGDAPADFLNQLPAFAAPFAGLLLDRLAPDTRALDAALQSFLHSLDRLGEYLVSPRSRLGVTAWVLTGAAALTALEWDRRRRAAAAGEVPLTWMDPEGPAPEPAL